MEYMIGLLCSLLLYISTLLFNYNRTYSFHEHVDNLFLLVKTKNPDTEMTTMTLTMAAMIAAMALVILK